MLTIEELRAQLAALEREAGAVREEDHKELADLRRSLTQNESRLQSVRRELDDANFKKHQLLEKLENGEDVEVVEERVVDPEVRRSRGSAGEILKETYVKTIKKLISKGSRERANPEAEHLRALNRDLKAQVQERLKELAALRRRKALQLDLDQLYARYKEMASGYQRRELELEAARRESAVHINEGHAEMSSLED